jgi:FkbM family methyltransferase
MSALSEALAVLNRLPIGERAVRIGGDRLYVASLDRWVAALGWKLGLLERGEGRLMARVVRPGMVAVDVGANVGVHTLRLARAVGARGRVHALEPEPDNFRLLERAVREAGATQVRLHAAAAADRTGPLRLYLSPVNRGDHRMHADAVPRREVSVPAIVLDELLADEPRVDFVKIDVQGAEVLVLRGLRRTLARRPVAGVLCELSPELQRRAGTDPEEFFALFRAAGLAPHRVRRDGGTDAVSERDAVAEAGPSGYVNLWFTA